MVTSRHEAASPTYTAEFGRKTGSDADLLTHFSRVRMAPFSQKLKPPAILGGFTTTGYNSR